MVMGLWNSVETAEAGTDCDDSDPDVYRCERFRQ